MTLLFASSLLFLAMGLPAAAQEASYPSAEMVCLPGRQAGSSRGSGGEAPEGKQTTDLASALKPGETPIPGAEGADLGGTVSNSTKTEPLGKAPRDNHYGERKRVARPVPVRRSADVSEGSGNRAECPWPLSPFSVAQTASALVRLYYICGGYGKAEQVYWHATAIREGALRPEDGGVPYFI